MGNININTSSPIGHTTTDVTDGNPKNWISQIRVGTTDYDIATHHGITFKDGSVDTTGVVWNGLTDIEVIIPSIADIVQTPIELAGTVTADNTISWISPHSEENKKPGNLVFITVNCTFDSKVCEAGDMAIWDGSDWYIVSGENQIAIFGDTGDADQNISIGQNTSVLSIEGKTLQLSVDYNQLNNDFEKGSNQNLSFTGTVGTKYIELTKGEDKTGITKEITISCLTGIKNDGIIKAPCDIISGIEFGSMGSDGVFPEANKNDQPITLETMGGALSLMYDSGNTTTGHFVQSLDMSGLKPVLAETKNNGDDAVEVMTGISSGNEMKSFITDISFVDDGGSDWDFEIPNILCATENISYVSGIGANKVVTSVAGASFTKSENGNNTTVSEIVCDLSEATEEEGDILSNISFGSTKNEDVVTATVSGNKLTFTRATVLSNVTPIKTYKNIIKATYNDISPTTTSVNTGTITPKTLKYKCTSDTETVYTPITKYLTVAPPSVMYNSYKISDISVSIPTNSVVTSLSDGEFPTYTPGSVTTKINKNENFLTIVEDDFFESSSEIFNAITDSNLALPGDYVLKVVDENVEGKNIIEVGDNSSITITGQINLENYVTGLK